MLLSTIGVALAIPSPSILIRVAIGVLGGVLFVVVLGYLVVLFRSG